MYTHFGSRDKDKAGTFCGQCCSTGFADAHGGPGQKHDFALERHGCLLAVGNCVFVTILGLTLVLVVQNFLEMFDFGRNWCFEKGVDVSIDLMMMSKT